MELLNKSLKELHTLIKKKELKPSELLEELLKRIEETEPKLNAYITVSAEEARKKAQIEDAELAKLAEDEIPSSLEYPFQ